MHSTSKESVFNSVTGVSTYTDNDAGIFRVSFAAGSAQTTSHWCRSDICNQSNTQSNSYHGYYVQTIAEKESDKLRFKSDSAFDF